MKRVMRIIPAAPDADTACLMLEQTAHPGITDWVTFLGRWGGGFIWPNAHHAPAEITALYPGHRAFNLQYLLKPAEVLMEQATGTRSGWWDESTLPIGRVSNGDMLLILTKGDQAGLILYWTPAADGLNYLRLPVAASFTALLSGVYDDPDLGLTPPWRRMTQAEVAGTQALIF